jgi:hypothetical protein
VEQGGGLIIAASGNVSQRTWPNDAAEILPGTIGEEVDRIQGGTVATLDYSHPVLELFSTPRSGDFTGARFFRYHPITPAAGAVPLIRLDDGSVALAERAPAAGVGRVLLWGSGLDNFANTMAVQAVYVPFVHQMVKYAATYSDTRSWLTVGQVMDLTGQVQLMNRGAAGPAPAATSLRAISLTVESPAKKTVRAPGSDTSSFLEVDQQGFYELKQTGARGDRTLPVAVNLDLKESDLSRMDPADLALAVAPVEGSSGAASGAAASLTPQEKERRQTLWWYILLGAVLLLGTETMLSNRLTRASR